MNAETPADDRSRVLNPGAVGDPEQTPIMQVSPGLAVLLEATRCPECGYVNHRHTDDCEARDDH